MLPQCSKVLVNAAGVKSRCATPTRHVLRRARARWPMVIVDRTRQRHQDRRPTGDR